MWDNVRFVQFYNAPAFLRGIMADGLVVMSHEEGDRPTVIQKVIGKQISPRFVF